MRQEASKRFRTILGISVAVVSGLGLLLVLVECRPSELTPTITPVPFPQSPTATPTATPVLPAATKTPVTSPIIPPESPLSTPETETSSAPAIPEVAPDFTLQRSGGGMLTLSEQLMQEPVVLVFFQRGGG